MKIYVGEDYEVYTEKNINEEVTERMKGRGYEGICDYLTDNFCEADIFAMLPSNVQSDFFECFKENILRGEFYEQYIDEPLPCDRCPFAK